MGLCIRSSLITLACCGDNNCKVLQVSSRSPPPLFSTDTFLPTRLLQLIGLAASLSLGAVRQQLNQIAFLFFTSSTFCTLLFLSVAHIYLYLLKRQAEKVKRGSKQKEKNWKQKLKMANGCLHFNYSATKRNSNNGRNGHCKLQLHGKSLIKKIQTHTYTNIHTGTHTHTHSGSQSLQKGKSSSWSWTCFSAQSFAATISVQIYIKYISI